MFALLVLFVLTIALTSAVSLASSTELHAHRTNAGQQAFALGESGLNAAVSGLFANYPGSFPYPGDPSLLPPTTTPSDADSAVQWWGHLCNNRTSSPDCPGPKVVRWRHEWRITAVATAPNPTAGGTPIKRTVAGIVPIVRPSTTATPDGGPLNFLYAGRDMTFSNSVGISSGGG
jgi:hypothetical protein